MTTKEGYSAALILSEGRYEKRMRHLEQELEPIVIEDVKKTNWVRVNDRVVKRLKEATA